MTLLTDKSTPFCAWCDDYRMGIRKLDRQHSAMLSTLNTLHGILTHHGDQALIDEALSDLMRQTKVHFRTEEGLMQAYDYPDYQKHKETHDILLCQLEGVLEVQQKLESRDIQQPWAEKLELADFLRTWLVSHIVDADKELGAFLTSRKVE